MEIAWRRSPGHRSQSLDPMLVGQALRDAEGAPCDDCRFARRCAEEKLACEAFAMFVARAGAKRWRAAPRAPTRARYEAVVSG